MGVIRSSGSDASPLAGRQQSVPAEPHAVPTRRRHGRVLRVTAPADAPDRYAMADDLEFEHCGACDAIHHVRTLKAELVAVGDVITGVDRRGVRKSKRPITWQRWHRPQWEFLRRRTAIQPIAKRITRDSVDPFAMRIPGSLMRPAGS